MNTNIARWFGEYFADDILEWFTQNLNPDEFFDDKTLLKYMATEYLPEEIFDVAQLDNWAEENEYEKIE